MDDEVTDPEIVLEAAGATVVARLTSQGCVPLDQIDVPPAPPAP